MQEDTSFVDQVLPLDNLRARQCQLPKQEKNFLPHGTEKVHIRIHQSGVQHSTRYKYLLGTCWFLYEQKIQKKMLVT